MLYGATTHNTNTKQSSLDDLMQLTNKVTFANVNNTNQLLKAHLKKGSLWGLLIIRSPALWVSLLLILMIMCIIYLIIFDVFHLTLFTTTQTLSEPSDPKENEQYKHKKQYDNSFQTFLYNGRVAFIIVWIVFDLMVVGKLVRSILQKYYSRILSNYLDAMVEIFGTQKRYDDILNMFTGQAENLASYGYYVYYRTTLLTLLVLVIYVVSIGQQKEFLSKPGVMTQMMDVGIKIVSQFVDMGGLNPAIMMAEIEKLFSTDKNPNYIGEEITNTYNGLWIAAVVIIGGVWIIIVVFSIRVMYKIEKKEMVEETRFKNIMKQMEVARLINKVDETIQSYSKSTADNTYVNIGYMVVCFLSILGVICLSLMILGITSGTNIFKIVSLSLDNILVYILFLNAPIIIYGIWQSLKKAKPQLLRFLDSYFTAFLDVQLMDGKIKTISFKNVKTGYVQDGQWEPVLRIDSLQILPGIPVRIMGPSGSSKTTFFYLMIRSLVYSGEINFLMETKNQETNLPFSQIQKLDLYDLLKVGPQNVELDNQTLEEFFGTDDMDIINYALWFTGMSHWFLNVQQNDIKSIIGTTSGGERNRLKLTQVIINSFKKNTSDELLQLIEIQYPEIIQELRKHGIGLEFFRYIPKDNTILLLDELIDNSSVKQRTHIYFLLHVMCKVFNIFLIYITHQVQSKIPGSIDVVIYNGAVLDDSNKTKDFIIQGIEAETAGNSFQGGE